MIIKVSTQKQLVSFIDFIKDLYKKHEYFTPPIFSALKKELTREVLKKAKYTALLCVRDNVVMGRIMYTVDYSKQKKCDIGYFSNFDCVDDYTVAKELFEAMEFDLSTKVNYIEGAFSPYDPDTRRGVLVKGFEEPHSILTAYNYPYYQELLEKHGYAKAYDTFTLKIPITEEGKKLTKLIGERTLRSYDVRIDNLDKKNLQRDIKDVHTILESATFELNYQEAPSLETITKIVNNLKPFLEPKLIKILRENGTNKPLGFCLVLPDYNEIFKKTNGKVNIFAFLTGKNKIKRARGILQYLIPEYQGSGFWALVFGELCDSLESLGFEYFEGGTILEDNKRSVGSLIKMGAEITKVYRLYGKEV